MFKPDRSVAAARAVAWATLAAAAFGAAPAAAQTAAPSPPPAAAKADAKADAAAEAAAAMERARRQAAGPLRVILEASRSRRRATDADPPAAAEASVVRPVVARTPAAAPAPQAAPVSAESRPAAVPPPAAAATPSANAAPGAPEPGIVTEITLNSDALRAQPAIAAVPALDLKGSTPLTGAAVPVTPSLALPELVAAPSRPRLASIVEPELPQRVLDEMGRNATVLVDLTIRPDGSVSKAALVSSGPRQLMRFLEPTLMEWKFDPLPSERVHRVELVFNGDS